MKKKGKKMKINTKEGQKLDFKTWYKNNDTN